MDMKITDIQVRKLEERGVLKGFANLVLDNNFVIKGIALLENDKGRWLGMPARKTTKGRFPFRDICHPINQKTRDALTKLVFEKYDELEKAEK